MDSLEKSSSIFPFLVSSIIDKDEIKAYVMDDDSLGEGGRITNDDKKLRAIIKKVFDDDMSFDFGEKIFKFSELATNERQFSNFLCHLSRFFESIFHSLCKILFYFIFIFPSTQPSVLLH